MKYLFTVLMIIFLVLSTGCQPGVIIVVTATPLPSPITTHTPTPSLTPEVSSTLLTGATVVTVPPIAILVSSTPTPLLARPTALPSPVPNLAQAIVEATQEIIPTAEPTTDAPADAEVPEYGDGLRLRSVPGLSGEVLDTLTIGTQLRFIGRTSDGGWFQVMTPDGKAGWVWGAYLRIFSDANAVPITGETVQNPTVPAPNGISVVSGISSNARQIFERGQQMGNRRDVFSKVGDSLTVATFVLYPFGWGSYNLGVYQHLQSAINFFSTTNAREGNSFANISLTADNGWTTRDVLNPAKAGGGICQAGETPLECEYRVVKPSVSLILIGTNDVAVVPVDEYRNNLQRIVQISVDKGVIPIVSTIPNRSGFDVSPYNQTIVQIAAANSIPLWDYWRAMQVLPNTGLSNDGVHPSFPSPTDFAMSANFNGDNLNYGYVIRNLTALEVLDAVWRQILSY